MNECDYSFDALYSAAFNKNLPVNLKRKFQKMPQEEINNLVKEWAKKANWQTKEKIGTDGEIYLSFFK